MKQQLQTSIAAFLTIIASENIAHSAEWEQNESILTIEQTIVNPVPDHFVQVLIPGSVRSHQPKWEELSTNTNVTKQDAVVWTPIEPSVATEIEEKIEEEATINDPENLAVSIEPPIMPSGSTFANDKAIWRDDAWHPQISGTVPIGYGPKGFMASGSLWAIDCVTGAGFCETVTSWDEYRDQFERSGEAQYNFSIGLGDAEELVGVTLTGRFEETQLPIGNRNTLDDKNIFSNYYVGAHLSRNLGLTLQLNLESTIGSA